MATKSQQEAISSIRHIINAGNVSVAMGITTDERRYLLGKLDSLEHSISQMNKEQAGLDAESIKTWFFDRYDSQPAYLVIPIAPYFNDVMQHLLLLR